MTIGEIKQNRIRPFEIDDDRLKQLFSFFLHSAPTVSSATALKIDSDRLQQNWDNFISEINISDEQYKFISWNSSTKDYLERYGLIDTTTVNRKSKGFVCKKTKNLEMDFECVLRHIRNSIGHSNVYMNKAPKRKYILFEDFNMKANPPTHTATLLFSQTDLSRLKRAIINRIV